MPTDRPNPFALDLDGLYARYLATCRMSGVEPVPRERADGLIAEWQEVLSGPPEPSPRIVVVTYSKSDATTR